jgi:DNA-binding LacI/PurR family transcriptional regulator
MDDSALPRHREISRQLQAEIAEKKFAPTGRLPSEAQLVKRFGVSRPTVARALRDLQAAGLIERRAGSGTFIKSASVTAVPAARQLGVLVPERGSIEIFELIGGELSSLARANDYALLFGGGSSPRQGVDLGEQHAIAMCEHFIDQRVAGVFFAPFEQTANRTDVNQRIAESFTKAGIPVMLLDRDLTPFPLRSGMDLVATDNVAGGFLAAEHVIKLGCRRVAFLARPLHALLRAGVPLADDWVRIGGPEDMTFVRTAIAGLGWEALLCANDLTAAQVMRSLVKLGVRVPQDLRVVGFDDASYASLLGASLTTIHQPYREIATVAFQGLRNRMAEPSIPVRSALLSPRLVIRESCGAYLRSEAAPA